MKKIEVQKTENPLIYNKGKKSSLKFYKLLDTKISPLRTVPTIVIAHTFCAPPDARISYRRCLLIQGYFCAV